MLSTTNFDGAALAPCMCGWWVGHLTCVGISILPSIFEHQWQRNWQQTYMQLPHSQDDEVSVSLGMPTNNILHIDNNDTNPRDQELVSYFAIVDCDIHASDIILTLHQMRYVCVDNRHIR